MTPQSEVSQAVSGLPPRESDEERSCLRKVFHSSVSEANRAVGAMREKFGVGLAVYKCRHCWGWHTGRRREDSEWCEGAGWSQ